MIFIVFFPGRTQNVEHKMQLDIKEANQTQHTPFME